MNRDEFDAWMTQHKATFPGLGAWFAKLDNREDVLNNWERLLLSVDSYHATRATEKLYLSETKPYYENHPRWILDFCKREAASKETKQTYSRFGQQTFGCPICHDSGQLTVYVYGNHLFRYIEMYGPAATITKTCSVNCNCEAGRNRGWPIYDSNSMIIAVRLIERNPEILDRRVRQVDSAVQGLLINNEQIPHPQFPPPLKILEKFSYWN